MKIKLIFYRQLHSSIGTFQLLDLLSRNQILSSSIMTSSFFRIRFYCCTIFIRYWFLKSRFPSVLVPTYHLLFPFIVFSWCIVVFIDNLRARTCEYANSVRYVSQQRRRTRFPHLRFPYQQWLTRIPRQVLMRLALGPPMMKPQVILIVVILIRYY